MAQLAQINIDDPKIADFVAQLDEVNALAEQSPGATPQAFWFSQLFPAPAFESVSA